VGMPMPVQGFSFLPTHILESELFPNIWDVAVNMQRITEVDGKNFVVVLVFNNETNQIINNKYFELRDKNLHLLFHFVII
jgi:hypothetical protein